jgi:CheY-like chemotaxis protein
VLAIAREHLLTLGYRVVTARSGDEALALLDRPENCGIDLLFSDVLMPGGMNGVVLAERVRERLPDVAILLTTGYNEELLAEGQRPASADVLGKPYRSSELADRVRAALNTRASRLERRVSAPRRYEGPRHEG